MLQLAPGQAPKRICVRHIWLSRQTLLQGEEAQNGSGQEEEEHLTCCVNAGNEDMSRICACKQKPTYFADCFLHRRKRDFLRRYWL